MKCYNCSALGKLQNCIAALIEFLHHIDHVQIAILYAAVGSPENEQPDGPPSGSSQDAVGAGPQGRILACRGRRPLLFRWLADGGTLCWKSPGCLLPRCAEKTPTEFCPLRCLPVLAFVLGTYANNH